ncbi:MAG: cob(I)yrinic acid a,c-diamide adenosyltransferase [Planctomycetota bacterium]|nr:cob(I)yrinic acid a,c-diamide adenosyltransferase [Planctomycetota bacterium]
MKLYTRRGDDGGTDLFGGQRVNKDSLRVEVYGTVDELNSTVGLTAAACRFPELVAVLHTVQHRLFELGADLATPRKPGAAETSAAGLARIGAEHVAEAEGMIDAVCAPLEPMRTFILPGGSELAARLHVARTVARRAERLCVALSRQEPGLEQVVIHLNRLSDLFFAMARRANQLEGVADVPWNPRKTKG